MHIADFSKGNLGANGIVGGGIPIAVGAALSAKRLKTGAVVVCFFGDGANNEGSFHESLNMAAIWKLPVVFDCENNKYGMSVSTERSTAVKSIAERGAAYSMPGVTIDGNNFSAVAEASERAVAAARADEGPSLIESMTYRWRGHSKSDRNRYRSKEEIAEWMANDPIERFAGVLREHGILSEIQQKSMVADVNREIAESIEFARNSPDPEVSAVTRDVYTGATALDIALSTDERVILMGEAIDVYGGAFQVTGDLVHKYGADRVMDTPIAELGGAGVAVGAALTGLRPIYEFQFSDFATLALEQIVNQAAKIRYMLGGAVSVPLVMRFPAAPARALLPSTAKASKPGSATCRA